MEEPTTELATQVPMRRKGLTLVPNTPDRSCRGADRAGRLGDRAQGLHLQRPVGAYLLRDGKPCYGPTIDFDGLLAIFMGIGVGGLTIWKLAPIFRALADRISRP